MAIVYSMINQVTCGEIALVDVQKEKLEGEAKDLAQGSAFHSYVKITSSSDYKVSANSNLVIITAGAAQKPGESRLGLVERNVKIMKLIIPLVLEHSPDAAICIVANPCDIMTAVANKIAGPKVPPGRIFGSGTCLDSSRLRHLVATYLDVDTQGVHGYVIGEHGDSSVPVWSSVRVGGLAVLAPGELPSLVHDKMHREVVESAGDVIEKKGYTNWAVGLAVAHIAKNVIHDRRVMLPLSTCVRGFHGIENDVFLSMPCSVGAHGVRRIMDLPLNETEVKGFQKSAETLWAIQKDIWDNI
jgi:L-lactate dehydrogenase